MCVFQDTKFFHVNNHEKQNVAIVELFTMEYAPHSVIGAESLTRLLHQFAEHSRATH